MSAGVGMSSQSGVVPPGTWAPHSMRCPATGAPAGRSETASRQPKGWAAGGDPWGADPAGDWGAALDGVPGQGGAGEAIVIVFAPAEVVGGGGGGEGGMGDTSGDDDAPAARQRFDYRRCADVGVGCDQR